MTHDHVFLEAVKGVHLAQRRSIGRTRVVSWKEAAEMKLSVSIEAFVIPNRTGSASAGLPPASTIRLFSRRKVERSTCSPQKNSVSPGSVMRHARHLSNYQFDMLIVNRHPLKSVNLLNFIDQEVVQFART